MFMTLFVVFAGLWLLGFFAFHVAGGLIHILLIIAVIALVIHFVRAAAPPKAGPRLASGWRQSSSSLESQRPYPMPDGVLRGGLAVCVTPIGAR